jgi:hypothetical protein
MFTSDVFSSRVLSRSQTRALLPTQLLPKQVLEL